MFPGPEPDCFSLGCLYCDAPTTETYCSQACRLAEAEGASWNFSEPSSPQSTTGFYILPPPQPLARKPMNHNSFQSTTPSTSVSTRSTTRFYLPPAYDFQNHKRSSVQCQQQRQQHHHHHQQQQEQTTRTPKLSPSSSRSSLKNELSVQAQNDLMYYTNAFDRSREWKRRLTH